MINTKNIIIILFAMLAGCTSSSNDKNLDDVADVPEDTVTAK